jgi:hypothetical protein
MTKRDEEWLLQKTFENNQLLKENNKMLKQIVNVLNYYISHAREENEQDFGRNVLANLISNVVDLRTIRGRR